MHILLTYLIFYFIRGTVFIELHKLYPKYACKEYLENWNQLIEFCEYREDNVPQLQDIDVFLKRMHFHKRLIVDSFYIKNYYKYKK